MKSLITGGEGILGCHLAEYLVKQNHKVVILDNFSTGRAANIKKINKYLDWSPKINIEKGIKILKENINYWKNAPVWIKDKINIATNEWFKYLKK